MEYFDAGFNGTDNYWKHPLYKLTYTDSVRYFCQEHSAYWTLDVIGSYMNKIKHYDFLIIHFDVREGQCDFYVQEDIGTNKIITQHIPYTDLRVSIKLYYENNVLTFPSDR